MRKISQATSSFAVLLPGIFFSRTESGAGVLKAGGDLRTARILARRPEGAPAPVLVTSEAAVEAFNAELPRPIEALSVDGAFDRSSTRLALLSLFLGLRSIATVLILTASRRGRSIPLVYSPSNALPDALAAYLSKRLKRGRRWVAVVHHFPEATKLDYGGSESRVSLLALSAALALISKGADRIIAYHPPAIRRITARGVSSSRVCINANAVDVQEFQPGPLPRSDRSPGAVLCVGRLSRQKGIQALLRAWARVVAQRTDAKLCFIGAEDTLTCRQVRAMAESLGLGQTVEVRGSVPRSELIAALRTATLVAAPSFVEGWVIAVLEALACGTPVVAWSLEAYAPFFPAVVTIPLGDEPSFGSAMRSMLDDESVWTKASTLGFQVAQKFSWDSVALTEWRVLEDAVPNRRGIQAT